MKVEFHSGLADKTGAACRFLRKAQAAGATVVVCAEPGVLDRLDQALWTFDAQSFVPHVRVKGAAKPPLPLARTPTWLVDDPGSVPAREVLLNLGPGMVADWQQFARVVEMISTEPEDARAGRERWRHYSGVPALELVHHAKASGS